MNITIACFGTYRNYGDTIELKLENGCVVSDVRARLFMKLQDIDPTIDEKLLESSRFASQTDILSDADALSDGMTLAVIPPVSGG